MGSPSRPPPSSPGDVLRRQNEALRRLSRALHWQSGDRAAAFRDVTEIGTATLGLARASIWLYDSSRDVIVCADLFDARTGRHEGGAAIARKDAPAYFDAIETERFVDASNALTDPRTACLGAGYLVPMGVGALLDAPVMSRGVMAGVVCHEHLGGPRRWTPEDEAFAGSMGDFVALALEAARRSETEQLIRERDAELTLALGAARMGTFRWNPTTGAWSHHAEISSLARTAEGLGALIDHVAVQDRARVEQALRAASRGDLQDLRVEFRLAGPEPEQWLELRGRLQDDAGLRTLTGTLADVTERKALEARFLRAAKMEAVARLAGGIAHDFNNLLTSLGGQVELLEEELTTERQRARVGRVLKSIQRAGSMTHQLLTFARRGEPTPRDLNLGEQLASVVEAVRPMLGRSVTVTLEPPEQPVLVRMDSGQLEQLVLNLVAGVQDTCPGGRTLTLAGGTIPQAAAAVARITVTTDGRTPSPAALAQLFEPVPHGGGAGLALAACWALVNGVGGRIEVRTDTEGKVRFDVLLPVLAAERPPADPGAPGREAVATVLVMDDDPMIRRLATRALTSGGYRVLSAATPEEATSIAAAQAASIDCLVADVGAPHAAGVELANRLSADRPELRILLITGAIPEDDLTSRFDVLQKPFSLTELVGRVATARPPTPQPP